MRVSTKCEGCSEAKPLGMPGGSAKRGRRAEGPEEPAGGLPPKRRRGLCRFASAWSHQQAEAAAKS